MFQIKEILRTPAFGDLSGTGWYGVAEVPFPVLGKQKGGVGKVDR